MSDGPTGVAEPGPAGGNGPGAGTPSGHRWVGIVAVGLYAVTGVFPYLPSGLVVPWVPWVVLMFCWGIGFAVTLRAARRRPLLSLAAVPAALLFWWGYVTIGAAALGWTA